MSLMTPEMSGMIEPVLVAAASGKDNRNEPIPERIEFLARRAAKLMALRKKPNREKKLVLMLHNAVCNGVEATIGCAFGLEPFGTAVEILCRLKKEGYVTGEIPPDGQALLAQIMEKKALSDFRWTAVEDILEAGGCIYRMSVQGEYETCYRAKSARFSMIPLALPRISTWQATGSLPGIQGRCLRGNRNKGKPGTAAGKGQCPFGIMLAPCGPRFPAGTVYLSCGGNHRGAYRQAARPGCHPRSPAPGKHGGGRRARELDNGQQETLEQEIRRLAAEDYFERFDDIHRHICRIDSHKPFLHPGVASLIARINPEYLVLEQISAAREENEDGLRRQMEFLR